MKLREKIKNFLDIRIHEEKVKYDILETEKFENFERQLIAYQGSDRDEIKAYLFLPLGKISGAILVHHQHNGERHLGKSEVSGIEGDPNQFFCPELSNRGIIALAPDSICFEDRRKNTKGLIPEPGNDFLQHYNEMAYRILRNETLMKKVVEDSSIAVSLLFHHKQVKKKKIGILGHSYGGNTVLFHSALDERIKYSCTSGAVCSYKKKMESGTGIEFAEVIPGFTNKFDVSDLLNCICPRNLLIISATQDKYSQDAKELYDIIKRSYKKKNSTEDLRHRQFEGDHPLNEERFNYIVEWFVAEMRK
jgi:dienelactone hydrolase